MVTLKRLKANILHFNIDKKSLFAFIMLRHNFGALYKLVYYAVVTMKIINICIMAISVNVYSVC